MSERFDVVVVGAVLQSRSEYARTPTSSHVMPEAAPQEQSQTRVFKADNGDVTIPTKPKKVGTP